MAGNSQVEGRTRKADNEYVKQEEVVSMSDELAKTSMNIILHAGNARDYIFKAIKAIEEEDFEKAKDFLSQAEEENIEAHKVHTVVLQESFQQEKELEYSVLFSHAQDTLMTVKSELMMVANMVNILENYSKRIRDLENQKEV